MRRKSCFFLLHITGAMFKNNKKRREGVAVRNSYIWTERLSPQNVTRTRNLEGDGGPSCFKIWTTRPERTVCHPPRLLDGTNHYKVLLEYRSWGRVGGRRVGVALKGGAHHL
jgi:hypothetical protein